MGGTTPRRPYPRVRNVGELRPEPAPEVWLRLPSRPSRRPPGVRSGQHGVSTRSFPEDSSPPAYALADQMLIRVVTGNARATRSALPRLLEPQEAEGPPGNLEEEGMRWPKPHPRRWSKWQRLALAEG